jgi:hypothetical protein
MVKQLEMILSSATNYGSSASISMFPASIASNFIPEEAVMLRGVNTCFRIFNFAGTAKTSNFHIVQVN